MGDIWNTHTLLLFLAFFIPGFIATQLYGLFVGTDDVDFEKQLPAVIGYSALHYAIFGWVILVAAAGPWRSAAAYIVVLVLPALWTPIILLIRDWSKWREIFFRPESLMPSASRMLKAMLKPEASPWDRVLDDRARFIRLRLKTGRFVGGYFATGSVVSSYPCKRAIYIAKTFIIDQETGIFGDEVPQTGLLVQGSEIETLETMEPLEEK
jgi:hypothetical protein